MPGLAEGWGKEPRGHVGHPLRNLPAHRCRQRYTLLCHVPLRRRNKGTARKTSASEAKGQWSSLFDPIVLCDLGQLALPL